MNTTPQLPENIFKHFSDIKIYKFPWWKRFFLWFRPNWYGYDWGTNTGDKTVIVTMKEWRGRVYITGINEQPQPKEGNK